MEFNTIAVSDGVPMGTEGMRASLVSREVIADSIEFVARGHCSTGWCAWWAATRRFRRRHGAGTARYPWAGALQWVDRPGPVPRPRRDHPGRVRGRWRHAAGKIDPDEDHALENVACPGAGACGGQFTANTMSMAMELLGISPAGLNGIPADHPRKGRPRRRRGAWRCSSAQRQRPTQILTRGAFDNAIAGVAASGGSTNAVLHLLAIAREAGVPLDDRRLRPHRRAHPHPRRSQAGGRYRRHGPGCGGRHRG